MNNNVDINELLLACIRKNKDKLNTPKFKLKMLFAIKRDKKIKKSFETLCTIMIISEHLILSGYASRAVKYIYVFENLTERFLAKVEKETSMNANKEFALI